jgi:tight adherence protein C
MITLFAENPLFRWLTLALLFGVVAVAAAFIASAMLRRMATRSSLQELTASGGRDPGAGHHHLRTREIEGAWAKMAKAIEDAGLNLADTNSERLTQKMRAAGFDSPGAARVYTLVRLLMVFVVPLGYALLTLNSPEPPSFLKLYLVGSALAVLGLFLPSIFIQARADRRTEEIVNGFPDCLDLLLVCVESGLGLEAALDRVGREMVISHPRVAHLLSLTTLQLRAGSSREEAFRKLADASAVDEIRSFTTLLIQSDKLGTSISTTLRIYAAEMREKRRMRAEEKAHRLPVLISIPLVACMLPTMIGTLMLPAIIMMVREVFPAMVGR